MPESEPDESSADVKPSGQPDSSSASPSASRVSLREQHGEDDRGPAHQRHSDLRRESPFQVDEAGTSASTTGTPDWCLGGRADGQAAGQDATSGAGDRAGEGLTTQQGDPGGVHGDEAGTPSDPQRDGIPARGSLSEAPVRGHRACRGRCRGLWSSCRHDVCPGAQGKAAALRLG